jgi:hypothetical protein
VIGLLICVILHIPGITKHLLSVHKFTLNNKVFFEFHPWHFLIKDLLTRKTLLGGRCKGGLYHLSPSDAAQLKQALISRSFPSRAQWHARLGHPSPQVVQSILSLNNILCPQESTRFICNACQVAKSHQLPYLSSVHRTLAPLELIHSDVWGPAPVSVNGYKYYISFIDDFTKFTWIYLMHDRSEAPRFFQLFQTSVERLLDAKIKIVQSDWGGESTKNSTIPFSGLWASLIMSHVLTPINKTALLREKTVTLLKSA